MGKINLHFVTKHSKLIGWMANIITIIGVALTSFDVYPLNIAVLSLACLFWVLTGILWKKPEVWTLNVIIFFIYVYGLIR
jgi:uncharacterized membrane protein